MTDNDSLDDLFDLQLKEQEYKKKKKLEKQERLSRKKILIDEIKTALEHKRPTETGEHSPAFSPYPRGTREWCLWILKAHNFSSFEEIKKNYLQLAQKYHPDKNQGLTTQEMKDLNEAWDKIKTQSR